MEAGIGSFIVWVLGVMITTGVCAAGGWFPMTFLAFCGIMLIWAVIVWGGFLIMDMDDFF